MDDTTLWETVLIPAFQKKHPGVEIKFSPTAPTEYDSTLNARLSGGTAGDLLACRPFDVSLALYKRGQLEKLDGKAGMDNFPASAKVAWQTDDGKDTFCMPIASVMHGFLYNKKIFRELKLQPPATEEEFFKVLETVKKSGKYAPLALGTADQWEANQVVFTSIGANYWKGEDGRKALIAGKAKFTDPQFVAAWEYEARLGSYLSKGASAQTYGDSQNQFALGKAAIYPAGSWDIAYFKQDPELELGAFNPPVRKAGDKCQISDHTDIGMSVNKKSKNKEDAYKFLAWLGSQEFADIYTNKVTGFFSLSNHLISIKDPVAKQPQKDAINSAIGNLKNASAGVDSARGSIGARLKAVDIQADENISLGLANDSTTAAIGNTDMAGASIELAFQKAMLEASQLAFVKISQLSLFNQL